jgi:hypothetical protein
MNVQIGGGDAERPAAEVIGRRFAAADPSMVVTGPPAAQARSRQDSTRSSPTWTVQALHWL